jgi:hypothetical protein
MLKNEKHLHSYKVKVLDFKYEKDDFEFLAFKYIYYHIKAKHEKEALKKARELYMQGAEGETQELPILLKLFSVESISH